MEEFLWISGKEPKLMERNRFYDHDYSRMDRQYEMLVERIANMEVGKTALVYLGPHCGESLLKRGFNLIKNLRERMGEQAGEYRFAFKKLSPFENQWGVLITVR